VLQIDTIYIMTFAVLKIDDDEVGGVGDNSDKLCASLAFEVPAVVTLAAHDIVQGSGSCSFGGT
jgi:hypothetical protein